MPSTGTFIARVETDQKLLVSIATMYGEARPEDPTCRMVGGWREQLRYLLQQHGRAVVIDALLEDVEGLSMRHAVTLADLAERSPSGRMEAART